MTIHNTKLHLYPATLANVIDELQNNTRLNPIKRRDLISAVNRTADMLGCTPASLPANVPALRAKLLTIHPVQAGITPKTFSNIKSDLAHALRLTRVIPRERRKPERSKDWCDFLGNIDAPHQAWSLSRLVDFCCHRAIAPHVISDAVLDNFRKDIDAKLLTKDPAKLCKQMAQTWNGIVKRNELCVPLLTVPKADVYHARPLTEYPQSLQNDVAAYLDRLSHADIFDEDGPSKPLRPTSLRNIEANIRQYLDALVTTGCNTTQFTNLNDLIDPKLIKTGFRQIIDRRNGGTPVGLHNIASTLLAIARYHVKTDPSVIDAISLIKKRVFPDYVGMTAKNTERLGQFDDWQNIARLIALPDQLMERAKLNPTSSRSGLDAMYAVAITILLACPMRVANLASLDFERHISFHQKGSHRRYSLRIEGRDVKNKTPIEVDLNQRSSRLLALYLKTYRGVISDDPGTHLFPQRSGGARSPANLSQGMSGLIYRETGLKMNAHLFRHLTGALYLKEKPGDYETVRRLLGHKKLDTTVNYYARLDNKWAMEQYDTKVLSKYRGGKHD